MGSMNIQYPFVSEGPAETQVQQIKDYLYQLADQLNLQDFSAEKVFEEVSKAIDADMVANGNNEQAAKLKEYANLKALIIKTGDYSLNHSEEFEKVLKASFSASSDMGQYDEELVQKVKENAEGIERVFDYTAGINNEDGRWGVGTKQFIKTGLLYYDEGQVPVFGVGVGVINKIVAENDTVVDMSQNQLSTYTAGEMAFWDNGVKVGYISGKRFHLPAADIRGGSIHIGEEEHNFFKVDTSGNVQVGDYFNISSAGLAKLQSANGKTKLDLTSGNMIFQLTDKLELEQSAEGISFREYRENGDLTTLDYIGGISAYLNPGMNSDYLFPTAKLSVFEVFDPSSAKVLGKLWDNGGTRSQLDVGGVYLRDGYDMDTEYGSLSFHNNAGSLWLNQNEGLPWFEAIVDENGFSVINVNSTAGTGIGVEIGVAGGNGQFSVWSKGSIKGGIVASASGAELRLGGGDVSHNMAWNTGNGSHLQADHHHFLGKSEGLFVEIFSNIDFSYSNESSLNFDGSGYSAIVLCGWPGSQDSSSKTSITIPVESIRVGNSSIYSSGAIWQIADDNYYLAFNIYRNSSGRIYMVAKAGSGHITEIYGIR